MSSEENEIIDFEQVYDDVEQYIKSTTQFSIFEDPLPIPTRNLYAIALMEKNHLILFNAYQHIRHKLNLIEKEISITDLSLKLQAIEVWTKRYEEALKCSQELKKINKQIITEGRHIQSLIQTLSNVTEVKMVPELEDQVEKLNEMTDKFSDQIREFDDLGYDVSLLKKSKLMFNQLMNQLQEKVDETVVKLMSLKEE